MSDHIVALDNYMFRTKTKRSIYGKKNWQIFLSCFVFSVLEKIAPSISQGKVERLRGRLLTTHFLLAPSHRGVVGASIRLL
jgi:hypothetical protein